MEPIKVSVCIVSYNQKAYIRDCLTSILSQQTDFRFEVIVSDDASSDGTAEIIGELQQQYPDTLRVFLQRPNLGPSENFNFVHAQAQGEYICHCDGDDLFLPGKLQRQAEYLDQHPEVPVVWHAVEAFSESRRFVWLPPFFATMNYRIPVSHLLQVGSAGIVHSSQMYRKSARQTYQPDFTTLDVFYAIEYLLVGDGYLLPEVLGAYRIYSEGAMTASRRGNFKIKQFHAAHLQYYLERRPELKPDIFIGALVNLLMDILTFRGSWRLFVPIACNSFSLRALKHLPSAVQKRLACRLAPL